MEKTKLKTTNFLTFSVENVTIPPLKEWQVSGKDWFYWGKDNKLPYYLYSRKIIFNAIYY